MDSRNATDRIPPANLQRSEQLMLFGALSASILLNVAGSALPIYARSLPSQGLSGPVLGQQLQTIYLIGLALGLVTSVRVIKSLGLGRYVGLSGVAFAVSGLSGLAVLTPDILMCVTLIQGAAVGGMGPVAFMAIFTVMRGSRLMNGLAVLTFVFVLPSTLAPLIAIALPWNWPALLSGQAVAGALVYLLARACFNWSPVNTADLKGGWGASIAIGAALASTVTVIGPHKFENPKFAVLMSGAMILAWASAGLLVSRTHAGLDGRLLRNRQFSVPIILNLYHKFAAGALLLTAIAFALDHGASAGVTMAVCFSALLVGQCFGVAASCLIRNIFDCRTAMAIGMLVSFASALGLGAIEEGASGPSLLLPLAVQAAGHVIFSIANLQAGAAQLEPSEGPTATIVFNATSLLGALFGTAFAAVLIDFAAISDSVLFSQPGIIGLTGFMVALGISLLPLVVEPTAYARCSEQMPKPRLPLRYCQPRYSPQIEPNSNPETGDPA